MAVDKKEYIGKVDWLYICQLISTELNKYVKAVEGKGLSSNDFTNELKTKLDGIDLTLYATLSSPAFTGTPTVPTADEGTKTTQIASTAFVDTAIANAVKDITGIKFAGPYESYADLVAKVTDPKQGTIYLVSNSGTAPNVNDEYFWDGTKFEMFGTTAVDLSDYLKNSDVAELTTAEVQAVWDSVFTS